MAYMVSWRAMNRKDLAEYLVDTEGLKGVDDETVRIARLYMQ